MNKILVNIRYKLNLSSIMIISWLGAYIISISIVNFFLIKYSIISTSDGSFFYRIWGILFMVLAVSLRFKEDFNYLLTLGNTRLKIFQTNMVFNTGLSVLVALVVLIEKLVVDKLNIILNYRNITDFFHLISPYSTNNILLQFLYFLSLSILISMAGFLIGTLFYRLGNKFTIVFWVVVSGVLPLVILLYVSYFHQRGELETVIYDIKIYLQSFNLLKSSMFYLLFGAFAGLGAYFNIRRLVLK